MDLNFLEKFEKNKNSLKVRITFFFVFFLVAVFAVFVITSVLQVNTVTRFICQHYAFPAVEKVMELIDIEAFQRLSRTLDTADPYYIEMQSAMLEIKEEANVMYLYTMAQEEGTIFRYIIDGSDVIGGEGFSELGDREDIGFWDRAAMRTFTTGIPQVGTLDQLEEWGSLITAYSPIIGSSGEVIGIVACDVDATEIVNWIRAQVLWQLAIIGILVSIGLVVYLGAIKLVNNSFALDQ